MTASVSHLAKAESTPWLGSTLIRAAAAWLFGLLLTLTVGIITIQLVNASLYGPQQPIREYLQAMRDGDGSRALGLLRANLPQASPALLDSQALKQAATGIGNVEISAPQDIGGRQMRINVTYSADGVTHNTGFIVEPAGTQWMFFSKWRFVPSTLPVINVSVVNSEIAQVNGLTVSTPGGKGSFAVFFPGIYRAELKGPLFEAPVRTVLVENGKSAPQMISLVTQPTQELTDQVNARLRDYLDGCSKQAVLLPTGCPLGWSTSNWVASPIKWTITKYPQAHISAYGGTWSIAPLSFKARITFTEQNNQTGAMSIVNKEESYGFSAKLNIDGNSVNVTPVVKY